MSDVQEIVRVNTFDIIIQILGSKVATCRSHPTAQVFRIIHSHNRFPNSLILLV